MTGGFAWILLLAASTSVQVVEEVYDIPASEWRYIDLSLKQRPGRVFARFETRSGSQQVRLALLRRDDLERLRNGAPHGMMSVTPAAGSGVLDFRVPDPGDYVVVVDNRSHEASTVHLRVWLDFAVRRGPDVTRLPPQRRLTVILLSFAFFFGIVTYSARRLLRVVRR